MDRGNEGPMDWTWQDARGPVQSDSPFITNLPAKKRPHSVLDSPSKSAFSTTDVPRLGKPDSRSFLFSQQEQKPLPSLPAHFQNSKAWEPRTPTSVVDFSSGGETPNTPAQDSDAPTPDTQMATQMGRLMNGEGQTKSPKKSRRESWLRGVFSSSPSSTKEKSKSYSTKAENRVKKRRNQNRKLALREDDLDDADQVALHRGASTEPMPGQPGYVRQAGDFFSWLEAHPHLPSVLSYWVQLLVNTVLGLTFLLFVYKVWAGVQADVNIEASKYEAEILREIALCNKQYYENRCDPSTRVPAMEHACGNWYSCMNRDPRKIAKASVTAKTFAIIFNSFVEEFSYKSMIFTAMVIFGGFHLSNWAFGVLRGKHQQNQLHDQKEFYPPPPATPQRHPSGGFIEQNGYYTPYQTPYGTMNQHMLHQATQSMPVLPLIENGEPEPQAATVKISPTKRRLFR